VSAESTLLDHQFFNIEIKITSFFEFVKHFSPNTHRWAANEAANDRKQIKHILASLS